MRDALNKELERQQLPTVSEEIFNWRMAQATPPLMRRFKKERDAQTPSAPSDVDPSSSIPGNRIVLPPIREQPGIAQYLTQDLQTDDSEATGADGSRGGW